MSAFHSFWSSDHTLFTVYLIYPFSELWRRVNQFWWDTDPHFLESSQSLISAYEELLERPHKHSPTLSAANCQTNLISLKDNRGLSSILYCSEIREWNSAGSSAAADGGKCCLAVPHLRTPEAPSSQGGWTTPGDPETPRAPWIF